MKKKSNTPVKFEDALARLEEIVSSMEGDVDLDSSLALFEEGVTLVRTCSAKLEETKKKIEVLVKREGGMVAETYTPQDADGTAERE